MLNAALPNPLNVVVNGLPTLQSATCPPFTFLIGPKIFDPHSRPCSRLIFAFTALERYIEEHSLSFNTVSSRFSEEKPNLRPQHKCDVTLADAHDL